MSAVNMKTSLTRPRIQLVELMQSLNFGFIRHLTIAGGEPVFEPPPEVIREFKFNGENGARPERQLRDFALKQQANELFEEFDRLMNGVVDFLEIKHGLPFKAHIRTTLEI